MDKKHSRPVLPEEVEALRLASSGTLALTPVFFNGQERYALVTLEHSKDGVLVHVLGVVTLSTDEVLDASGRAGFAEGSSKSPSALN